jgi:hypothetical protein
LDDSKRHNTSLKSRFKKAALVTALAVNAVTLCNSFLIADRGMRRAPSGEGFEVAGTTIIAPLITDLNWSHGNDPTYVWGGPTPISFMGDIAQKHSPAFISGSLNAAFTIVGAPGAWVGHLSGCIVGAFSPSTQPDQSPATFTPQ